MEYFVSFLLVAGFGYFLYTKIKESRARKADRPESDGPRPGTFPRDFDRDLR